MSVWWEDRLVGFDCETTGVNLEQDRIVTAALVTCGGGIATESLSLLACPAGDIPAEATAVHGITTEHAKEHGLPAGDVVAAVLIALEAYLAGGRPLIAMNARFDLTLLDREARRYDLVPLQDRLELRVVDPMVIDRHLDRYRSGSRKLTALCEHYGVNLDGAHDATHDALAACRLAYRIGSQGEIVRRARDEVEEQQLADLRQEWKAVRSNLEQLHDAQVEWAFYQAIGLAAHFRRKGEDADVQTQWPICPLPVKVSRDKDAQLFAS